MQQGRDCSEVTLFSPDFPLETHYELENKNKEYATTNFLRQMKNPKNKNP